MMRRETCAGQLTCQRFRLPIKQGCWTSAGSTEALAAPQPAQPAAQPAVLDTDQSASVDAPTSGNAPAQQPSTNLTGAVLQKLTKLVGWTRHMSTALAVTSDELTTRPFPCAAVWQSAHAKPYLWACLLMPAWRCCGRCQTDVSSTITRDRCAQQVGRGRVQRGR